MKRFVSMISCLSFALLLVMAAGCKPQTGTPEQSDAQSNFFDESAKAFEAKYAGKSNEEILDTLEEKLKAFSTKQNEQLEEVKDKIPEELYQKQKNALSTLETLGNDAVKKCRDAINDKNPEKGKQLLKALTTNTEYVKAYQEFAQDQKNVVDPESPVNPEKEDKEKFNWWSFLIDLILLILSYLFGGSGSSSSGSAGGMGFSSMLSPSAFVSKNGEGSSVEFVNNMGNYLMPIRNPEDPVIPGDPDDNTTPPVPEDPDEPQNAAPSIEEGDYTCKWNGSDTELSFTFQQKTNGELTDRGQPFKCGSDTSVFSAYKRFKSYVVVVKDDATAVVTFSEPKKADSGSNTEAFTFKLDGQTWSLMN